ncbi:hypothetical protein N9N08_00720 [bacterium]|jgi:hypothetical protein|nr:hypothetical protein [bacterium]
MTTSLADKRRKRFLKEKEEYKDVNILIRKNYEKDVDVYFNKEGEILQIGNLKRRKNKKETKITMSSEQVEILKGKNLDLYRITQDPIVDTVYSVELKPTENLFVKSEEEFLQKIDTGNIKTYDVLIEIKDLVASISLSKKAKKLFQKKTEISINGSKVLKFYFTAKNDPHYMIHGINVFLKELIDNNKVDIKLPLDVDQCDIYTYKLFDKYVRT